MRFSLTFLILILVLSCSKDDIPLNLNSLSIKNIQTFGGSQNDVFQSIKSTNDGGYIAVGHTQSSDFDVDFKTNNSFDFWIVKFNTDDSISWNKTFGGSDDDRATDVIQLNDGSFIITGFSRSANVDVSSNAGNYDFWTIKLDANGNLLWEKSFGFSGADQAYTLHKTNDGNILIGGSLDVTASGGQGNSRSSAKHAGGDYWLIKIDANGNQIWSRYFGGLFTETLTGIEETDAGNYILTGYTDSNDTDISNNIGSYDFWIVKVSANSDLIWEKNFGGTQIDEAFAICKTTDNHFLIAGNSRSDDVNLSENYGSSDVWIIKIDVDGNLIWQKNYGGSSFENALAIIPSTNGGFYATGSSRSSDIDVTNNNGNKDVWILKIDANGNLENQNTVGGSNLDEANSLTELINGDLILAGFSQSSDGVILENKGFSDALLIKIK